MNDWGHELDFARGYIFIFPTSVVGNRLFISKDCPESIRQKVLELWPGIEEETTRRHELGIYSENDYFFD